MDKRESSGPVSQVQFFRFNSALQAEESPLQRSLHKGLFVT